MFVSSCDVSSHQIEMLTSLTAIFVFVWSRDTRASMTTETAAKHLQVCAPLPTMEHSHWFSEHDVRVQFTANS